MFIRLLWCSGLCPPPSLPHHHFEGRALREIKTGREDGAEKDDNSYGSSSFPLYSVSVTRSANIEIHIYMWSLSLLPFKVDALNLVIGPHTHLHDAHIDMDRLKFVFFRIYNQFQMCRKQNKHCSLHVDSDGTVYNMGMWNPLQDYFLSRMTV